MVSRLRLVLAVSCFAIAWDAATAQASPPDSFPTARVPQESYDDYDPHYAPAQSDFAPQQRDSRMLRSAVVDQNQSGPNGDPWSPNRPPQRKPANRNNSGNGNSNGGNRAEPSSQQGNRSAAGYRNSPATPPDMSRRNAPSYNYARQVQYQDNGRMVGPDGYDRSAGRTAAYTQPTPQRAAEPYVPQRSARTNQARRPGPNGPRIAQVPPGAMRSDPEPIEAMPMSSAPMNAPGTNSGPVNRGPVNGAPGNVPTDAMADGPYDDGPNGGPYDDGGYGDDGYYDGGGAGGCGGGCCNPCGVGRCGGPIYVRGEYLSWWLTGQSLPALVTTSTGGTAQAQAGVLGQSSTSVLFGDGSVNTGSQSGGRVVLGWWIDPSARIEAEYFGLGQQTTNFNQTSDGSTILARPFFNLSTGAPDSHLVAYPGQFSGSVHAGDTTRFLGAGIHATQNLRFSNFDCNRSQRLDFLYGFRYLHLGESLSVNDSLTTIGTAGGLPAGSTYSTADKFQTTNNFYGFNMGLSTETRRGRWLLTAIGRMGIGGTSERINISGSSASTVAGSATVNSNGGLLALPTNIGTYTHNGFTVVPQLELKLAYDLTPRLRINVGYDLIYWSRVVRPGDQISTYVNPTQSSGGTLTGTPGPLFAVRETDLWIQGVSVGGEYRF